MKQREALISRGDATCSPDSVTSVTSWTKIDAGPSV